MTLQHAEADSCCTQGDIESVAGMNPRELTAMLELVSGSEAYRAEYDRLQGEQKEAEAKLRACFSNKKVC